VGSWRSLALYTVPCTTCTLW